MEYTLKQRLEKIIIHCLNEKISTDPLEIFAKLAQKDFVRMHGPEHHLIDGACLLTAFRNKGGSIDLKTSLVKLAQESEKMPGAMCGNWGVCGAATGVGCALSILEGTGPLSTDGSWGSHIELCGEILKDIGKTKGPRCCKRDGAIAIKNGAEYITRHLGTPLDCGNFVCIWQGKNSQCIGAGCPFGGKSHD